MCSCDSRNLTRQSVKMFLRFYSRRQTKSNKYNCNITNGIKWIQGISEISWDAWPQSLLTVKAAAYLVRVPVLAASSETQRVNTMQQECNTNATLMQQMQQFITVPRGLFPWIWDQGGCHHRADSRLHLQIFVAYNSNVCRLQLQIGTHVHGDIDVLVLSPHPTPGSTCMCASVCVIFLVCKCQGTLTSHPTPSAYPLSSLDREGARVARTNCSSRKWHIRDVSDAEMQVTNFRSRKWQPRPTHLFDPVCAFFFWFLNIAVFYLQYIILHLSPVFYSTVSVSASGLPCTYRFCSKWGS